MATAKITLPSMLSTAQYVFSWKYVSVPNEGRTTYALL